MNPTAVPTIPRARQRAVASPRCSLRIHRPMTRLTALMENPAACETAVPIPSTDGPGAGCGVPWITLQKAAPSQAADIAV